MLLGVIVVVVIIAAIIAVVAIAVWQRKSLQKSVRIELNNEGNTRTRYELKAEDPDDTLEFAFSLAGRSPATGEALKAPQADQQAKAAEPSEPAEKARRKWIIPSGPSVDAEGAKEKTKEAQAKAKEAQAKTKKAMGFTGAIAEVLMSLGMILPRSLGRPLLDISSNIRRTQGRIETAERMPGRVSDQASKMKKAIPQADASQIEMPKGEIAAPEISIPKATKPEAAAPEPARAEPAPAGQPGVPVLQTVGEGWVRTPPVEPGGRFQLDLLIRPLKPRRTQLYSFGLVSRAVGVEKAPIVREEWTVRITGASGWRRYHPYLFIAGLTILTLLLALGLASLGVLS